MHELVGISVNVSTSAITHIIPIFIYLTIQRFFKYMFG